MSNKRERNSCRDEDPELGDSRNVKKDVEDTKVITSGDAKLIISGADKMKDDTAQPREIAVQPRAVKSLDGDKSEDENEEHEQPSVVRLEKRLEPGHERIKVNQAKFEKLESKPDRAEQSEENWSSAKMTSSWWIAIAGMGVAVILIAGLILKYAFNDELVIDEVAESVPVEKTGDAYAGSPQKWFHDNDIMVKEQAIDLLEKYVISKNNKERSAVVRDPKKFLDNVGAWEGMFKPRAVDDDHCNWSVSHARERGFLVLTCKDADFMPLQIYFTRGDDDQIQLDWHATVGWSTHPMKVIKENLKKRYEASYKGKQAHHMVKDRTGQDRNIGEGSAISPGLTLPTGLYSDPVTLRCLLTRRNEFYAGPYNAEDHSAFMLRSADRLTHLWGYVERDSKLDHDLRRLLDHGRFVIELKKNLPVTVKVKRAKKDALPSQLELMELVHPNWVSP